jgi:hypothetical protein
VPIEWKTGYILPDELAMTKEPNDSAALLANLQRKTFQYFWTEVTPSNGLVVDSTKDGWPASIAAVGMALAIYPIGVERSFITRKEAVRRTLTTLRFFWQSPQGTAPDATGYRGFYYHFLDMQTGKRVWNCELSTIDTAFLLAGALAAAIYFDQDSEDEHEIRSLAEALYRRADWRWAQNGGATVVMGWKPESGFLPFRCEGYDEALLLYILGLGSPTHPLPAESYKASASTYEWKEIYGHELLHAGPLFIHQLSHMWIDFRGLRDQFMREHESDYFENSRRATYVQQKYAIQNPQGFSGYGEYCWGLTASEGPGPATHLVNGVERVFFDYVGRGVPLGPDDGTVAPWSVVASLPFAPEIVIPTIQHLNQIEVGVACHYGLEATINPTFPSENGKHCGWLSPWHYGINEGPMMLMIENYQTGFLWNLMRQCSYIVSGLRKAGFIDGWL